LPLSRVPLGTVISCIELRPGQGALLVLLEHLLNWQETEIAHKKCLQVKQD
jgi:hypothetical protein